MDFHLTREQEMVRKMYREFAENNGAGECLDGGEHCSERRGGALASAPEQDI